MARANKIIFKDLPDLGFWMFLVCVLALPIGFGGNRAFPLGLAQAGLALSCLCLFLGRSYWTAPPLFSRLRVGLGLLTLVLAWVLLQSLPFVPESWVHPIWKEAADVLRHPLHATISLSPEDSLVGFGRLFTYIAVGVMSYLLAQSPNRARQIVNGFWAVGTLICAYGLIEYIAGGQKILWVEKTSYQTDLTATFVNRNHFAIYAGMVLVSGAALLWQSWREKALAEARQPRSQIVRDWLVKEGVLRAFSLLLILLCIVLSHSRSGLVLSLIGVGSYFFFYFIYRKEFSRALMSSLVAFIVLVVSCTLAVEYSERFPTLFADYSSRDRFHVYELSLRAIQDNPWLGYGLGCFQDVFRLYQRGMIMEFEHAHSDFLESLMDLGVPVALALWTAILLFASGLVHGITRRRRHGLFPALGLSCCILLFGHAMIDFSMEIPGVVCSWALLLGCGLAQSWRLEERKSVQGGDYE